MEIAICHVVSTFYNGFVYFKNSIIYITSFDIWKFNEVRKRNTIYRNSIKCNITIEI